MYDAVYAHSTTLVLAADAVQGVVDFHYERWQLPGNPHSFIKSYRLPDTRMGKSYLGFQVFSNSVSQGFAVPCWFCVGITALLSAGPWLTYRFSLRTLLIATTLVAVLLGLSGYALRG
jgi:hypothetical protein